MKFKVVDCNEAEIKIGTHVKFVDEETAIIIGITDPDGDVNDEGRSIEIPPYVEFKLVSDGTVGAVSTYNITKLTWADYPDGPEEYIYQADDLEKV